MGIKVYKKKDIDLMGEADLSKVVKYVQNYILETDREIVLEEKNKINSIVLLVNNRKKELKK